MTNLLKQEPTCIYQPSEATVSSDQVFEDSNASLQSALQLLHVEIDCCLSTYGRKKEDSKSWRQGWQAVMFESLYNVGVARQTNLVRGHKNDF